MAGSILAVEEAAPKASTPPVSRGSILELVEGKDASGGASSSLLGWLGS